MIQQLLDTPGYIQREIFLMQIWWYFNPFPTNQSYELRQILSRLGTQNPQNDTDEFGLFGSQGPLDSVCVFLLSVTDFRPLWPQTDFGTNSDTVDREVRLISPKKQNLLLPLLLEHLCLKVALTTRAKGIFCHPQFSSGFCYLNQWRKLSISSWDGQEVGMKHHSMSKRHDVQSIG